MIGKYDCYMMASPLKKKDALNDFESTLGGGKNYENCETDEDEFSEKIDRIKVSQKD